MKKELGIALGSGSMRGFAHLGVLKVLEENGIPISCIAGSSMGAVIGGIYACGTDLDMLEKIVPNLVFKDYMDMVIPKRGGFLKGEKFKELISLFTKGYDFSQTKIPFCCVAVDLNAGELVEMKEGKLIDAIRASMAIPGVFEPFEMEDGRVLVDGGTISRVPSQTARAMGAEVVIGIDVGYRGGKMSEGPKSWMDFIRRGIDIQSWTAAQAHEKDADLIIAPDVYDHDPTSFDDFEKCVDAGKKAAEEALPVIQKLLS